MRCTTVGDCEVDASCKPEMESQDLRTVLTDIVDRLKALEASAGNKKRPEDCIAQDNGPHEEVTWDAVLPSTLTKPCDTTPHALPLLFGVPPPWAN